jgi:sulfite reductase beta subunit-like hemoprotein
MPTVEPATRNTPETVADEITAFESRLGMLERGQLTDDEFRPFRLKYGIYSQRQPGFQMVRVKIPSGLLASAQLRTLGNIGDAYSNGRGHLTTRENCQFHFVRMQHVPAVLRLLADAGLTTREACGNAVRNVTACPLAGVCGQEVFDVTPYALATTQFFLRHPEFQNLPRKFKIAFSGCAEDGRCALAGINDIGLIARVQSGPQGERRGFQVLVGGGLGSLPTAAVTLADFIPEEELLPLIEAILMVFNQHGNRQNKHKARLKFVLRERGLDEFRRMVSEKRQQVKTQPHRLESASPVLPPAQPLTVAPGALAIFENGAGRWRRQNVQAQSQPGFFTVWVKLLAGNIQASQMKGLASLMEVFGLPAVRVTITQNLVLPWVPQGGLQKLYHGLQKLELATPGAGTIADVTGCPGATTCNLGITRSLTLAEMLAGELANESDPEVQKIRIMISGCPNACGQHHLADIGFYGNARKAGERLIPYYQLMLGGKIAGENVQFARQVLALPARRIPQVVRQLIGYFQQERLPEESFHEWSRRVSDAQVAARLAPYLQVTEIEEEAFTDWGDQEKFSLKLGRGECSQ